MEEDRQAANAKSEALALPVEIRRGDSLLLGRGTVEGADRAADNLEPGAYHVGVTLPSGEKVQQTVTLGADPQGGLESLRDLISEWPVIKDHVSARLYDALSAVAEGVQITLPSGVQATRSNPSPNAPEKMRLRTVALASGSGKSASLSGVQRLKAAGGAVVVERPAGAAAATVQIVDPGFVPLNVVLPSAATLTITCDADGERKLVLSTGLACADDILRLRGEQRLDEVAAMLDSLGPEAVMRHSELLLSGALVIAYGLLRTANAQQMGAASDHLLRARPNDPDVLVIAGEVWAREANHVAAMRCFLDALTYGLPVFSFGLNYIVERLRLYSTAKIAVEAAAQPEVERLTATCRQRFEEVQGFALRMDFEGAITAYEGYDPANPLAPRLQLNATALFSAGATLAATTLLGLRSLRKPAPEDKAQGSASSP